MSANAKQPIKRLEIQINNFNVAIPLHVNLLRGHKNNIKKYQEKRDWDHVRKEQINISRLVKQLKVLLHEMDTLRTQVQDSDIEAFDKLTVKARESIMNTITECLELESILIVLSANSTKDEDQDAGRPLDKSQVQLHAEHEELQRQKACLHAWSSLQSDIRELHELFLDFNKIIHDQREQIDRIDYDVQEVQVNVTEGAKSLSKAAKYKLITYPLTGAVIGMCVGGPVGLIAGLKLGGLTALGCGVLGFTGGTILKKKQHAAMNVDAPCQMTEVTKNNESS